MNVVTDAAAATRAALGRERAPDLARVPPATRYAVLALALLLSAVTGIAAFEAFSPVAMLQRELIYGAGLGLTGAAGIFLLDAFVLRRGWCGHLCPLGAFWALVGKATRRAAHGGVLKLAFDDASCSHCGDCVKVCPEPRALHFAELAARGQVAAGECTRCARCVAVCPESSLRFALQPAPVAPPAAAAPERLSTGAKP